MNRIRLAGILLIVVAALGQAQQPPADSVPDSGIIIQSETRVVLVDAIVGVAVAAATNSGP